MKHLVLLFSLVTLCSCQTDSIPLTNLISPLPKACTPGDLFDNYGPPSACVSPGEWQQFNSSGRDDIPLEYNGPNSWRPTCSWAFQDRSKKWHCPYETASGRVVGCNKCSGKWRDEDSCKIWEQRCLRRVEAMKSHTVCEPSSYTPPKDEDTNKAGGPYRWKCPHGFRMDFLGEHEYDYDPPICVR